MPGVVPRPTGQKKLCLCSFFLPDSVLNVEINLISKWLPEPFWIYFSTLPPIVKNFLPFFELNTKAAFAKAALDTPRDIGLKKEKCPLL